MPSILDLRETFKTLREVDLNAIRQQAEMHFSMVVLGRKEAGKTTLISQMRSGDRPGIFSPAPVVSEYDLSGLDAHLLAGAALAILLIDARQPDLAREREVFDSLRRARIPILVAYNHSDQVSDAGPVSATMGYWSGAEVVVIAATDRDNLKRALVPKVLQLWPDDLILSLARHLPLFRSAVVKRLVDETSMANATFAFSTGLAEIVPLLDIPSVLGDMVVLTKNQALLAYKVALAEGLEADWQHTIPELTAVVGAGFLWRQIARELVGLVPVVGIIPKVAIAYSGTQATGRAVQLWAETGEKMTPEALRALTREAIDRGQRVAQQLAAARAAGRSRRLRLPRLPGRQTRTCPHCGHHLPSNARFCPQCAMPLTEEARATLPGKETG